MLTQDQALAELRQLNQELGLAEDDGLPMTQAQAEAELRALDEELASTPESFDEYVARRKQEDSRSLGEKTSAFTDSFITGAGTLAEEGGRAIKQLFAGDVGLKEAKGVFQVGVKDFGRFAKTLGGAAMDNFYSDENEMRREYERYKDNFLYNQNVRTAMLDTFDEKGRDFVSFGANFVDPTMFIPIAGQVSKAASVGLKSARLGKVAKVIEKGGAIASKPTELIAKGTRKALEKTAQAGSKIAGATGKAGEVTSKVASFPRDMVTKLASKTIDPKVAGSGILGAQVTGAFTGAVPGLGLLTSAEVAGYIANKSGRGMERVLTALGSEAGQKRFLQRLAMQADSPTTRKLALYAHKLGGTRMGDMAFNSLVNGISVSTLNGALAYASTDNIEELGQAMGAGFAMGGALPVGQPGMRAGRSQAARNQSSVNFLEAKLGQDQLKHFRKMDPDARLAFATVEEAGIKAPKLMFVDKNLMLETLRQDDPNIRQAPNAYFDQKDNTIYVNENGRASKSSKEAFDILTHELGHGFITQAIKDDPFFARKILEQYEAKPGEKSFEFAFTKDSAGAPIDSIMLNEDAKKIASAYDSIQEGDKSIGVGQDANLLAQEIGAEQFAMMMVDNPNYFNTIEPSLRQKLLEGSRKVLTLFGAVDGNTGNPLDVSISPILKRNKSIRNLYKNYTKQRDASIADKVDLADKGVAIKVRKGESADQAVERLYGKQGISLKEAGAFRIDNKKVKNELTNILNRVDETPEGGMSSERNPKSGRPQSIVGKQLSDEVKGVFTRKDPRGTINMLINDITESIRNRLQLNFLYRSGKPSKYSDNELKARVVSPVRFKVTGLSKTSRSAASLKMDAIDEAYLRNNVEVLAKEGFTKDPNKLIEQAREVARQALDNEGRINPEGNFENELITAVFGQKESAPQIKDARLRELLAAKDSKLQHAYRSYDVDALAGLVPTGKSGIAFDWFNIKNNYSPFDDKLFIPAYHGTPHTFSAEPGAPFGRFRTSAIGTGEGAQAYGHGLYFAGKREVADYYRSELTKDRGVIAEAGVKPSARLLVQLESMRKDKVSAKDMRNELAYLKDDLTDLEIKEFDRYIDYVEKNGHPKDKGSLYKVELAPKENEYLLWDKPLSEQPKGVREKVQNMNIKFPEYDGYSDPTGNDIYNYASINIDKYAFGSDADILSSNALKEAGIPGIKYLDGSSRSKGEGDYNYVIFDEADVAITEKLFMPAMPGDKIKGFNTLNGDFPDANDYLRAGGKLSLMSPREYIDLVAKEHSKKSRIFFDELVEINPSNVAKQKLTIEKDLAPVLFLDTSKDYVAQEGLHRAKAAEELGLKKVPVILQTKPTPPSRPGQPKIPLFMPVSEAGAGKGKQAEAAKLWQEKGTDSPYFKKWFGKSKVVDENGEPLVVYHGTGASFNTFNDGFSIGPHFGNIDQANDIVSTQTNANIKPVYLSIKNPLRLQDAGNDNAYSFIMQLNDVLSRKEVDRLEKLAPDNEEIGKEFGWGKKFDEVYRKTNKEALLETKKLLMSKGYDGIVYKNEFEGKKSNLNPDSYIAFEPNQIKSATGNRGTFDAGERNILFMPAGGDKLTATHNLSAEALAKADELGGLPVPSVGITKGRALEGFGEVTLLGTRPLVDPELGVPAFGSDVYSKRFPREKYKPVKMKKADDFVAKYRPFANETGGHELSLIFDALVNSPDLGDAKWRFMSSDFAKMAFLKDKGKPVRVPKKKESVDAIVDQQLVNEVSGLAKLYENIRPNDPEWKQYSKYLRDAFDRSDLAKKDKFIRDTMLENLFDEDNLAYFGPGDRILRDIRKFGNMVIDKSKLRDRIEKKFTKNLKAEYEKWATQEIASLFDDPYIVVDGKKVPLTLDTATDSMTGRIRAVEKNMTFGPGEARSMGSPKFSNIQEMRNRSDVLVSKEKFDSYKENIQDPVHEAFRESAMQAYKYSDGWTSLDLSYRALGQYLQSFKGSSKQRMKSALRKYDFIPNDSLVEKAIKAAEVLRDAPTEYFEAKPQRAVKLEEFTGAVIPKKASPKVKELADKYGWEVKTYDPNKPETRQTSVRQLANRLQRQGKEVLFMPSDRKAPTRQPANRITRQAPAMPGNRFMLPAVSAGAKSAERFR